MDERIPTWMSLDVTAYDIVPVSRGGDEPKMVRLRDFLGSGAVNPVSGPMTASILRTSVNHLLDRSLAVEQDYIDLVRALVSLCPAVLDDNEWARLVKASGLLDKIAVYNDLYANLINPTLTKAASKKMLGTYLIDLGFVRQEHIDQALADQNAGLFPGKRLGDILQVKGIITRAQLDQAIELQMVDSLEG